jgi:hypothetical protein
MRKVSLVLGLLFVSICACFFGGALFMPRALGFLDPLLCPGGGRLSNHSEDLTDREGTRTGVTLVCLTAAGEAQDITVKGLAIIGALVVLSGLFLVLSLPFSVVKNEAAPAPPRG